MTDRGANVKPTVTIGDKVKEMKTSLNISTMKNSFPVGDWSKYNNIMFTQSLATGKDVNRDISVLYCGFEPVLSSNSNNIHIKRAYR
jgi:hypothetical protein